MQPHHNHDHTSDTANGQRKAFVADQEYDHIERNTLETCRVFFVSFNQPETQFWMHAYRFCESVYSKTHGAAISQATLSMLNAMRYARPHTFNFTDPRCSRCSQYITPEERYLIDSFRHIRHQRLQQAQMTAMLLCEGKDPSAFLSSAKILSDHLVSVVDTAQSGKACLYNS
ncbi:hypothetical protein [Sulfitobacter donghicola]|uniref:Uncharacterized protein n=1 Tax=Sulfitobacter donghicola DSW-25 = KCTC 12864 = JCM 14565 TaxID=1300350 RepID=A0A073IT74_9RHOB|nr:hypothetical protein [Sulfitobacter donghicola]KEJ88587.1 hypothetical protein DSW25_15545 [Sulfitobacter donghicola DSW-25 = KCTC 12864 = JCM 14565]KIN69623.1 hypothetical protein Z948_3370 [Sulfitobacter donghicola DSW-25 = KCTC 12864 = JCM 14565]